MSSERKPGLRTLLSTVVLLQVLASICYPIAKFGLQSIEPFTFAFYRFCLASLVLLIISYFTNRGVPIERKDWPRIILLGVLIIPINQTLFLLGQSMTAAGHGAFIFATTPVWIFVLAIIHLREKSSWRRVLGIVVALAGVFVIMLAGSIEVSTDYLWGDLIILVSVMGWAYYTVLGKPLVQKYGAIRVTALSLAIGSVLYFPFGLYRATQFDYSQPTMAAWGAVVYMALGMSVVVYVLWYWVLKRMDASRLTVYHNIQPVIATTIAWLALGEQITTAFLIGGAIVLSGVILAET